MMLSLAGGLELHHPQPRQNLQGGRGRHRLRRFAGAGSAGYIVPPPDAGPPGTASATPSMSSLTAPAQSAGYAPAGYASGSRKPVSGWLDTGEAGKLNIEIKDSKTNNGCTKYRFHSFRRKRPGRRNRRTGCDVRWKKSLSGFGVGEHRVRPPVPGSFDLPGGSGRDRGADRETVCARRKTTRIAGADFPHEVVRVVLRLAQTVSTSFDLVRRYRKTPAG